MSALSNTDSGNTDCTGARAASSARSRFFWSELVEPSVPRTQSVPPKDDPDMTSPGCRECVLVELVQSQATDPQLSGSRAIDASDQLQQGRLAAARGIRHRDHVAGVKIEVHVGEAIVGAFLSLTIWWMNGHEELAAEDVDCVFRALFTSGLSHQCADADGPVRVPVSGSMSRVAFRRERSHGGRRGRGGLEVLGVGWRLGERPDFGAFLPCH